MRLGSVVLRVRDLERSRHWYESRLGLRVREVHEASRLALLDVGSAVPLSLWELRGDEALEDRRGADAFPVLLVDNAEATRAALESGGTPCGPLVEEPVCWRFSIRDPDGNRIDLAEMIRPSIVSCEAPAGPQVASDMTVAFSADQPGTLARALEALTRAGLDTGGYAEIEGYFHLLVPDPGAARRAFEQAGFRVEGDQQVVVVDVENRPGSTAGLFRQVADAGVNVAFTYATADGRLVIGTPEVQKLRDALGPTEEQPATQAGS
jgi:catechol 2,3-dioxygenase-like lactoylglutathione lyase family enzyme